MVIPQFLYFHNKEIVMVISKTLYCRREIVMVSARLTRVIRNLGKVTCVRMMFVAFRDHFETISKPFRNHFETISKPFRHHFDASLIPF